MDEKQALAREKRRHMMLEEPMIKVIPKLAIPMIISSLIDSIYNLADTYFVSRIGTDATAAVAVNDSLMGILGALAMGFALGASSYISRLLGAKQDQKASKVGSTVLIIGAVFSLLFGLVCLTVKEPLVTLLGVTESAKQYSVDYATWILLAAPFTTMTMILNQLLRSEGSSSFAMVGMVSGCVLNIALDPIFINVLGLEVAGAAIATAISKIFSTAVLFIPYIRGTAMLELRLKNFEPKWDNLAEVVKMGVPTFLRMSLMSVGGIITNHVAKGFGTAVLAANSIANKISRFVDSAIMGFGQGFAPCAGFCWGAKKYSRVREAFFTTIKIGCVCAVVVGGAMFFAAAPLVNIFNAQQDAVISDLGTFKVRIQCLALIPHIITIVTSMIYSALGKPLGNLILSLSRQLLILIPVVLIVPAVMENLWNIGEYGLVAAQATSDIVAFVCLTIPFAAALLKQIKPLKDGDPPPFKGKKSGRHA